MPDKWAVAQDKELAWQAWYYGEHIPHVRRYELAGYRYCEGRYQMLHCGIPHGGLKRQEITGELLDVGCGAISIWEQAPDLEVLAIDPLMARMAEHPRLSRFAKLGPKFNAFYVSKTPQEVGRSGQFDWVWCYNMLDHTRDWQDVLAHCKRVLKPGGILLLGTDVRTSEYDWSQHDDEREMHPSVFSSDDVFQQLLKLDMEVKWKRPLSKTPKQRLGLRARKSG